MRNNINLFLIRKSQHVTKNINIPKKKIYNVKIVRSNSLMFGNKKKPSINSSLPNIIDLRNKFPPVYNQGNLGSCTANAFCGIIQYLQPNLQGSRLFLYYNERKLDNNIPDDSGATLSDGIICLLKYGICQESEWPYIVNKFAIKPPNKCYINALNHQALIVNSIEETLGSMKSSLANGKPFVVGIAVYTSFESNSVTVTGIVPMPNTSTETLLGGHAIICVGYNNSTKQWIMRNSWGKLWGDKGYFYLPYAYLLDPNLASDMWTITKME